MGADWPLGFIPYENGWRTHRRLFHRFFSVSTVERFDPRLFKGTHDFLRRLADFPESYSSVRNVLASIWTKGLSGDVLSKAWRFTYPLPRVWYRGRLPGNLVLCECSAGDSLPWSCHSSRSLPRGFGTVRYASTQVYPLSSNTDITLQSSTFPAGYLGSDSTRSQPMREGN
jgi:hypothetical protein